MNGDSRWKVGMCVLGVCVCVCVLTEMSRV